MTHEQKRYTIFLCGNSYEIVSDDESEIVRSAIQRVETLLQDIAARTQSSDQQKTMVLAALTLAREVEQCERQVVRMCQTLTTAQQCE